MTAQETELDPFAQSEKNPAISFKDAPIGTTYKGTVVEPPKLVQARNFETKELAYWPDGNKKMTVVTTLEIEGQHYGLWAAVPSAMYRAIGEAQKAAGTKIAVGGTLIVKFSGEEPNAKNPRLNPQKLYEARYIPPADPDPWGEPSTEPPEFAKPAEPAPAPAPAPSGPSAEQIAAVKAAGLDPAAVFPGYTP